LVFFLQGLWLARNGAEASEASRSAVQRQPKRAPIPARASRPDPEVVAKPKRRTYTAEYKQRILLEAEAAAATPGGVGALSAGKVCTRRCWPIGGANGPMASARL
jgi:hypothetical protein